MHEVSIALNLIEVASEQCMKSGYNRVDSINLKIGKASGIMIDALMFAFHAVKNDSLARSAELNVEEVPVSGICNECEKSFTVEEDYVLCCPLCTGTSFSIETGREMDIIDMEVS